MRTRALRLVALRVALMTVFAVVVALSFGCDSNNSSCTNGDWQCDSSRKEIDQCVDGKWKFVELCVGANNFCRSGTGFNCHGIDTACCDVLPQ